MVEAIANSQSRRFVARVQPNGGVNRVVSRLWALLSKKLLFRCRSTTCVQLKHNKTHYPQVPKTDVVTLQQKTRGPLPRLSRGGRPLPRLSRGEGLADIARTARPDPEERRKRGKGKPPPCNLEKELLGADKPAVVATDAPSASARGGVTRTAMDK